VLFHIVLTCKLLFIMVFFTVLDLGLCLESINEMTLRCVWDLLMILSFRSWVFLFPNATDVQPEGSCLDFNVLKIFPSWIYLQQAATCLSEMDQSPPASVSESMQPFLDAIVKPELLKHQDRDVKLLVATCICEITRITAPEAPYSDDVLKVCLLAQLINRIS